jgi:hypothetical protein
MGVEIGVDILEDLSCQRVHAIFGASFWQNPANHPMVRAARAGHDRANSLPFLRQAFTNCPTLLSDNGIVDKIVQVGLWFAGEPDVDAMLFDFLKGPAEAQRLSFARVLLAHPGFTPGAPASMNTAQYRRTLCDHVRSVLTAQPSWRADDRVTSGIETVRRRFPDDASVQAMAGWMIAMQGDDTIGAIPSGGRNGLRPVR